MCARCDTGGAAIVRRRDLCAAAVEDIRAASRGIGPLLVRPADCVMSVGDRVVGCAAECAGARVCALSGGHAGSRCSVGGVVRGCGRRAVAHITTPAGWWEVVCAAHARAALVEW